MDKIIWYLKQLLPLKYESTFTEIESNDDLTLTTETKKHVTWRMWFGICFNESYSELGYKEL